jgi:hypothetical protein
MAEGFMVELLWLRRNGQVVMAPRYASCVSARRRDPELLVSMISYVSVSRRNAALRTGLTLLLLRSLRRREQLGPDVAGGINAFSSRVVFLLCARDLIQSVVYTIGHASGGSVSALKGIDGVPSIMSFR